MSLQFSRSMRALNIDSYRASRLGLILACVNIGLLLAWFFMAKVTLYETSNQVSLAEDGRVIAQFPQDAMARIFHGQNGILRVDAGQDQPLITLPCIVVDIQTSAGRVELLIMEDEMPPGLSDIDLSGRASVEIEVEYVTPGELVMRASGKYLNRNQVPVSPQNIRPGESQ